MLICLNKLKNKKKLCIHNTYSEDYNQILGICTSGSFVNLKWLFRSFPANFCTFNWVVLKGVINDFNQNILLNLEGFFFCRGLFGLNYVLRVVLRNSLNWKPECKYVCWLILENIIRKRLLVQSNEVVVLNFWTIHHKTISTMIESNEHIKKKNGCLEKKDK